MLKLDVKNIIADTAEALFKKYDVQKVTIQQIADACGTSRTTFYRYFNDKFELMNWIYQRNVDVIVQIYSDGKDVRSLSAEIYKFVQSQKEYFYYITKYTGQNSFYDFLIQYGYDYYEKALKNIMKVNELPYNYQIYVKAYCHAGAYLLAECIKKNCVMETDEFAEISFQIMPLALRDYFS